MSTPGVFAGVASLLIVPVISYYANSSNNSWKRKWYTIFIGLSSFLIGLFLLITAGVIKIVDVHKTLENFSHTPNISIADPWNIASANNRSSTLTFKYETVPVEAILGIVGFGMIDMSYDVASPAVKSFVLDTVPSHQHSMALATSTVIQGVGGTFITVISLFDLPAMVESIFNVDGLAGAFLVVCSTLVLFMTISFSTTLICGFVIGGWMGKRRNVTYRFIDDIKNNKKKSSRKAERHSRSKYKRLSLSSENLESISLELTLTKKATKTTFTTDYSQRGKWPDSRQIVKHSSRTSVDEQNSLLTNDRHRHIHDSYVCGKSRHSEDFSTTTKQTTKSYARAHSSSQIIHACTSDVTPHKHYLRNKRVIIVCISCFFANGCLLCFSLYSPNALTIGVYKGDPLALPGSPGRQLYEKGMRHGALGILLMYISHLVFSASNHKLMKTLGEKPHYFAVCTAVLCSTAGFVGMQTFASFCIAMALFGCFRSCCITTSFIIVSKIVTDEILQDSREDGGKTMGGAISLLGMMMPANYLILSSLMGPLIDATDNVWVPIFYTIATLIASTASFALLYCVRYKKQ